MEEHKEDILDFVKKYMEKNPEGFKREFGQYIEWRKNPPLNLKKVRRPDTMNGKTERTQSLNEWVRMQENV